MERTTSQISNESDIGWVEESPVAVLNHHDLIDYACGMLGSLQKLAEKGKLPLLAHLIDLARNEAVWRRGLAAD